MSLLAAIGIPPCYEAKSSPEQWDTAFEKILQHKRAQDHLLQVLLEERMSPGKREDYADLVRSLCHLQLEVATLAFETILSDDLAVKWLAASPNDRKKHVLIGIAGVCSYSPNLNQARCSCTKELRVSYLSTDGHILLELINAIAPDDLSQVPAHPQYVNNHEWDSVQNNLKDSQDGVVKLALLHVLALRNKLITYVLQFIMCSFLGRELPHIAVQKKAHSRNKAAPTPIPFERLQEQALVARHGKKRAEEIKAVHKAAYKERAANKVNSCRGCNRQVTTRETFKRCGACWRIDRETLYCSEGCQRANWKQHKLICGKPMDYDMAVNLTANPTTSTDASGILPPANGFKPTLELRLQMKYLKKYPARDYLVMRSVYTNKENLALMIYRGPVGPIFRKHRDNAMKSGDRCSVALICDCILWDIEVRKAVDFRREMVVDQISREYRFPLAELEKLLEDMAKSRARIQNKFPVLAHPAFTV